MKKTYKVAVIGCGNRGTDTAEAYNFHPRVELVGLCDVNQNAFCPIYGCFIKQRA